MKPSSAPEPLLPAKWEVPQVFRDRLGDQVGRQRLMQADGQLLLVLHAPPGPDDDDRRGRLFWRDAAGAWKPTGLKHGQPAIDELLDEYERAIEAIDPDDSHTHTADECLELLRALAPLLRSLHNVHSVLQEARMAVTADRQILLARDRAYVLARRAELLQQDMRHTLDFVVARRAEEHSADARRQANAAHRLNVLVALFFPMATVAAVFGMNLHNGMEHWLPDHAPIPLMVVLGASILLGALLVAFVNRE